MSASHRGGRTAVVAVLLLAACNDEHAVARGSGAPDGAAQAARERACVEDFSNGFGLSDAALPVSFRQHVMPLLVTHCNLGGCHLGNAPTGQLGLGDPCMFDVRSMTCVVDGAALTEAIAQVVYANLTSPSITAPKLKRVEPGIVDRSFILMKLSGCQNAFADVTGCGAKCGQEMPPNGALRDYEPALFDRLARWVREGAPLD